MSIDGGAVEAYTFDVDGNRTSKTLGANPTESASYDAQDRLVQRGSLAYTFDADGYLESRGSDSFQYSRRGELLQATVNGSTVTYTSDALGRRVARTDANGTTQYLYGNLSQPFELTAEIDPSGTQTIFLYQTGYLYAFYRGTTWYSVGTDQVGTPLIVGDATGIVRQLSYTTWGEVLTDTNPGFDLPVGFAGGLADPVSDLIRFGLRDYEPASGRFTAKDPAIFRGGYDLYAYAANNPTRFVQPGGSAVMAIGGQGNFGGIGGELIAPMGTAGAPGAAGWGAAFFVDSTLQEPSWVTDLPQTRQSWAGLPSLPACYAKGEGRGSNPLLGGAGQGSIALSPSGGEGQGEGVVGAQAMLTLLGSSEGSGAQGTGSATSTTGDSLLPFPAEGIADDLTADTSAGPTTGDPLLSGDTDGLVDPTVGGLLGGQGFGGSTAEGNPAPSANVAAACGCNSPIDIAGIVANGQNQNDNAAVGLASNVFVDPQTDLHLDLPCGAYYLDGIYGASPVQATARDISISVHGITVLYVGTNIITSGLLEITVDPTAQLSLFVAGTIQSTQPLAIGSTEVPSQTSVYVGGSQGVGSTSTALIAGSLYSPNGPLDMNGTTSIYGSLLTTGMDGTGAVTIHYDQGLQATGAACPATSSGADEGG